METQLLGKSFASIKNAEKYAKTFKSGVVVKIGSRYHVGIVHKTDAPTI